jgi:vacuolar protein sorting-associated protein 13A/C
LDSQQKKSLSTPNPILLDPGERMWYSWDIPIAKHKTFLLKVGKRKRQINFQAIGTQVPFVYHVKILVFN